LKSRIYGQGDSSAARVGWENTAGQLLPAEGYWGMDELGFFTAALGLSKPWRVMRTEFDVEAAQLDHSWCAG
jgi:hypothetical protein